MDRIDWKEGSAFEILETMQYWQAANRDAVNGLLSFFNDQATSFFVSGCQLTETPGDGTVTHTVTEGWAAHNGEIIRVSPGSIVRASAEVAWLEPEEVAVDVTAPLNSESVGEPMLIQRRMVLKKGSNFPAQGSYLMLDESINQLVLLENKLRSGLLRVKAGFFWFGSLDDFDDTGLGLVDTEAEGLALCNGNNGTIDMRGLAPVGAIDTGKNNGAPSLPAGVASNYALNDLFGVESVTLSIDQIPAHNHGYSYEGVSFNGANEFATGSEGERTTYDQVTTDDAGGGESHENRQPSRAILFVQRVS